MEQLKLSGSEAANKYIELFGEIKMKKNALNTFKHGLKVNSY